MDSAVATLDFAKAGAIIANMIEAYLAAGAPPLNAEGADHAESEDCRSSSDAKSLHLHSSVGDGASRCDLLSGVFAFSTLEQGLASITGTVRGHQNIGVRRRWLLRSVRLQRQPCPRHERHVRASRTAHHSRAPPRR